MLVQFISVCSICFSFFSYWLSQENIHQRVSRLCAKNNYGEKCWSRPIPYNSGPILQHIHLQLLPQQELLHDYEHLGFWKVLRIQHQSNCYEQKVPMHGPILECGHPVLDLLLYLLPQQDPFHDHYDHLDFWKDVGIQHQKTVKSKRSAYFGDMDLFLSVDTLYYFTFLCLSSCPEYLRTKKEKVHWPLSQLVCCCLCVVTSGPLPSTCPTSSACLPEEIYKHRPHDEDCQSTCEHLRIRKQCILSKQSRSCKLECRILIM